MGNTNTPSSNAAAPEDTAAWLTATAAQLLTNGLPAILNETAAGLDMTATLSRPGRKELDVIVDEDGYAELHWWADPGTTPAELAAVITRTVAAITGASG